MLQPFELFKSSYVDKLIGLKKNWLVSQTYRRNPDHFDDQQKVNILLSDFDDPGLAKVHLNAVKQDRYASIIYLKREAHRAKLEAMLKPDSRYRVFWAVIESRQELEKLVNSKYKDRMRAYIENNTNWRISGSSAVRPVVQLIFGELYIVLKHAGQQIRIKFEEIEKSI
jgi:hypothetical protein